MTHQDIAITQGTGGSIHCRDSRYSVWIEQYVERELKDPKRVGDWDVQSVLRGQCYSACLDMQEEFPELRLVRGWVVTKAWSLANPKGTYDQLTDFNPGDGHFWLETETGLIVDPTARQFHEPLDMYYIPFDETLADKLPTGRCVNCGDYCYGANSGICSDECARSYEAYLQREIGRL